MMQDEQTRLLALLDQGNTWCRHAEAADPDGNPVTFDDERAVAWDITGAMCRLFGWDRARELFGQVDRHIHGKRAQFGWPRRDVETEAMVALQEFNDQPETSLELLREQIETMPVWHGKERPNAFA